MDDALSLLKARLSCVVEKESCFVQDSDGRILAKSVLAPRSHPPCSNTAVDGNAVSGAISAGPQSYQLRDGRAAAAVCQRRLRLLHLQALGRAQVGS